MSPLDRELAAFLRKTRGELTYRAFAQKLGIHFRTLHRLEHQQQSATLKTTFQILKRLKCKLSDIFPQR